MIARILFAVLIALVTCNRSLAEQTLDRAVVFTRVPKSIVHTRNNGHTRIKYGERGEIAQRLASGEVRVLTIGFQSAADPEVSFDGTRLLFAGKRSAEDPWNIFEMDLESLEVRQVTRDTGNCRNPVYQSTFYTIVSPEPWQQLTFVSDAAGEGGIDDNPCTHLYSCRLDGSEIRRLTYNPYGDLDPVMLVDGRILFVSRQHSTLPNRSQGRLVLFAVNSDGTDLSIFSADEGETFKQMPAVTPEGFIVFVETDHSAGDGSGHLAAVLFKRHLHSYRRLTQPADGRFYSPAPYARGGVLVSRREVKGNGTYDIFLYNLGTGEQTLLYEDPNYHLIQARLLEPRAEVDGRSSVVTEKDPNGQLYALDVTISDLPEQKWLNMESIGGIRFLEAVPGKKGEEADSPLLRKRILGESQVHSDGSFFVEVPANIPLALQLLDKDGLALRTCSWFWTRNHERRGCIGCHEDPELTPPNRFVEAVKKPPIPLTQPPRKRRTVEFSRDVLPLMKRSCGVGDCHSGPEHSLSSALSSLDKYVHPGQARTSPLIWHIFGRNTSRPWDPKREPSASLVSGKALLTEEERRLIAEWIDLGAQGISGVSRQYSGETRGGAEQ